MLESYAFSADAQLLIEAPGSFAGLRQQLEWAPGVPAELLNRLAEQQQMLSTLLSGPDQETQIQQWLDSLELGLWLLMLSQWLYQRADIS